MSWIFGYFGNTDQKQFTSPETPLYSFKDSNLILLAGGNKQTCFFKSNTSDSCVTTVGLGLLSFENDYKILNQNDWNSYLTAGKVDLKSVNGHFVAIKYSGNEIKFFTDELGLRDIHIVQLQNGFGFTTRIDWLKYFIEPEIDFKEFGARWLLQNQISRTSIIKNVKRLVCANATIRGNSAIIEKNEWQPNFEMPGNREIFEAVLRQLLRFRDKKILLSLSGGLDSRLLLSYLSKLDFDRWDTHTFGDVMHPDSIIACKLLKSLNRDNEVVDEEIPSADKLIELIKAYSVQTIVTNPVSSILNIRFYNKLLVDDKIILDGGFGEIWRRAFANRLLLLGRNALIIKDAKAVSAFLRYQRVDIFSEEAVNEMEKGIVDQFEELFSEMPDANQIGFEKWIDLFSIRSRLTNYYSPEQARVDHLVVSFMPLVQKDILNLLFGINDSDKRNGKLFKQLISQNSDQLTKQPLVKGNITHPFNSSSIGAGLDSRIKNIAGLSYKSKEQITFLSSLKEFIGDLVQSFDVKNYEYYDRKKLYKIVNNFLSEESDYNSEVDWFLSFELFRQGTLK